MKKNYAAALLMLCFVAFSFSPVDRQPTSSTVTNLKKPAHVWIGAYRDNATNNVVYITVLTDYTTVFGAKLGSYGDPRDASATGTLGNSGYITNFHTVIGGHAYDYTGYITLL